MYMCTGLRGAVAFALAENLAEYFPKDVTGYLVTTTLLIVLFTIIVLGGSTMPLLKVHTCTCTCTVVMVHE